MSAPAVATETAIAMALETEKGRAARPRFLGVVRGEMYKLARLRLNWVMLGALALLVAVPYLFLLATPGVQGALQSEPGVFLYEEMNGVLALLRVFSGIVLLIMTARTIGMEYQHGTIRVLLARGVGRLQLLTAKLTALAVVALTITVGAIALNVALLLLDVHTITGSLDALQALPAAFWPDARTYLLTVLISMGVTILLAAAITVVGRSPAFGLTLSLAWFPADNIGTGLLFLIHDFTQNAFWLKVTAYLLGPNLNLMPVALLTPSSPASAAASDAAPMQPITLGTGPLVDVTGQHTLVVALVYAAVFAVVAAVLVWRRDVTE